MSNGFFGDGGTGSVVDLEAFMDSNIPGLVAQLIGMGCLVSFGTTRDGGAVSISVTHDGERARSYFRDVSDAVDWLERGSAHLRGGPAVSSNGQGPVPRKAVSGTRKRS
jgi:hypothetical protein